MTDSASRIDALEMRLAERERTLDDLDATVTAQWAEIDALKRGIAQILVRLSEAEHRLPAPVDRPPPHY